MEIDIEKEGIEKSKVSFHVLKDFFLYFQSCLKDKKNIILIKKKTQ
jgi:hypothetical protein